MKRIDQFRKHIFSRIHPATLTMTIVIFAFVTMLAWTPALPAPSQVENTPEVTATEMTISSTPEPTPIPQEWVDNREQTTGIIAGAIVLAIVIIGGTLHTISKNKEQTL
jgi:hypothetical protein